MLEVLAVIGELILFVIVFGIVVGFISYLSEKYLGYSFDPFNIQEDDSDMIKITKIKNNIRWATRNGEDLNDLFENMTKKK